MRRAVLLVLALGMASPAAAETWRLITGPDFGPYTDPELPEGGWSTALVTAALAMAGHKVDLDWGSWKRGYSTSSVGSYDGTFPYARNAEREALFHYAPAPVARIVEKAWVLAERAKTLKAVADLKGQDVCRPEGYALLGLEPLIAAKTLRLQQPSDMLTCFRLLGAGRTTAVMTNEFLAATDAQRELGRADAVEALAEDFGSEDLHLIVPKKLEGRAQTLLAEFARGMKMLLEAGGAQRIADEHLAYFRRSVGLTSK